MAGWSWQAVHDPAMLPSVLERWTASINTAQPFEITFPLLGADGIFRPFLTRVQPMHDARGVLWRWFGVNSDVSAQQAVEAELAETLAPKELLLDEVNHRVKNSLQLVTSLLVLQAGSTPSPTLRQGLLEARSRIGVVIGIHQCLYENGLHDRVGLVTYFQELAASTIDALRGEPNITVRFIAERKLSLPLAQAVPLA